MVELTQYGAVTRFVMGRTFEGKMVYSMACYLVDGLLIDSGPYHIGQEFLEAIQAYPVEHIVNTHHHEDHIANNHLFQEHFKLPPAWAHPLGLELIRNPHPWAQKMNAYRQIAWGEPEPSQVEAIPARITTPDHVFDVLHTPGHSPDHIALLERNQGWLFAGDLFISEHLNTIRSDEDANEMIRSLQRLVQEPFETIFCASGAVRTDGKQAMQTKLDYWLELREQIFTLNKQGSSQDEIIQKLFGSESRLAAMSEGDMSRANFVRSILEEVH